MKKILLFFVTCISVSGFGQDTTSWRMIAGGFDELQFYNGDSTFMTNNSFAGTVHVLFTNPKDSMLYAIIDDFGSTGDRNLYSVDPFSGTKTLLADLTITYPNSGDLGEGDVLYLITGQGDGNPGVVTAVDMNTFSETTLYTSATSGSFNPTATEYNPTDSSLYIFESFGEVLYIYDLATAIESSATPFTYITSSNTEHHGAFYDETNDIFHFGAYGGDLYTSNSTPYTTLDMYYDHPSGDQSLDLCYLDHTLRADTSYFSGFCPGEDSVMISLMYNVGNFSWYRDGILLPGMTNDTIWVSESGNYQALMEIGTTGNYMWSEPIELDLFTVPVVTITASDDSLLCANETDVTLTGVPAGGGTTQWYMNGSVLTGETGQTLVINQAGIYNQLKTNMNGCSDSASTSYILYVDPTPINVNITQAMNDTSICTGEILTLDGSSGTGTYQWYMNGALLSGETNATLDVTTGGWYNQIFTLPSGCADSAATGFEVTENPLPVVTISQVSNDSLICPGETIVLDGATGGTLQWYMNGSVLTGETGASLNATAAGSYNQLQTLSTGCADSAATAYIITVDTDCGIGFGEEQLNLIVYPNPAQHQLYIQAYEPIEGVRILDLSGKLVKQLLAVNKNQLMIDVSDLDNGIFLIEIQFEGSIITKKITK